MKEVKRRFFYGWVIVAASFCAIMPIGAMVAYGVFFNPMGEEFGWTRAVTAAAFSIYILLFNLLSWPMGWMYDKYGPRTLMPFGGLLTGVGLLGCSQITSLWHLYLFYGVIVAIGTSPLYVSSASTVMRWFTKRRGLVVGIVVSGIGVGTLISSYIAGYLILLYNWRVAFAIVGVAFAAITLLAALVMKPIPKEMGLRPYGESEERMVKAEHGVSTKQVFSADRRMDGFTMREAFETRSFWTLYLMYTLGITAGYMVMVHIVPFATDIGILQIVAAGALGSIGFFQIIGRILMGAVSDRLGRTRTLLVLNVIQTFTTLWLTGTSNVWMLYTFAALFGLSYGGYVAQCTTVTAEFFGLTNMGAILGALSTAFGVGGAVGPILGGYVFDTTGSYHLAFWCCTVLYAAATMFTVLAKPPEKEGPKNKE